MEATQQPTKDEMLCLFSVISEELSNGKGKVTKKLFGKKSKKARKPNIILEVVEEKPKVLSVIISESDTLDDSFIDVLTI